MVEALANLEADTCPGCGGRLSETMHQAGKHNPWVATFSVCDRCVAIERAQVTQGKDDEKREKDGAHIYRNSRHWMAMTREQSNRLADEQAKQNVKTE